MVIIHLTIMIPYLRHNYQLFPTEKYIINECCSALPLRADPGDPIPAGGAAHRAISTGEVVISNVPKEIYGAPFRSYAIPVKENDDVVGCILVGKSLQKSHDLRNAYKNQYSAQQQISRAIGVLSDELQNVAEMNNDILQNVAEADESTRVTDEILNGERKRRFIVKQNGKIRHKLDECIHYLVLHIILHVGRFRHMQPPCVSYITLQRGGIKSSRQINYSVWKK